jgi:hypothetical protein
MGYILQLWPIPVIVQSKAQVSSCAVGGITGLNSTEGMDVCLWCLFCVALVAASMTSLSHVQGSPTRYVTNSVLSRNLCNVVA